MSFEAAAAGRCVVWTGLTESAMEIQAAFERQGAAFERHPLIVCELLTPSEELSISPGTWAVFTSARAAAVTADISMEGARIVAVGKTTAATLERFGRRVDLLPDAGNAAAAADALIQVVTPGTAVIFFKGDKALPTVPTRLRAAGIEVREETVYRTSTVNRDAAMQAAERIRNADAVLFGSPAGVNALSAATPPSSLAEQKPALVWAALGRTTGDALRAAGIPEPVIAARPEPEEVVRAICSAWARNPRK